MVMPFGLKNAGATYQRAATTILHDLIHREVEVYVDDMIIKSKSREGHIPALRNFFERFRQYQIRLNLQKCVFGVTKRKVLGYVISKEGIEIDSAKVKAIREMLAPRSEREIRGLLGKIQFISRFISQLISICETIFKLLRKSSDGVWNEQCQEAFEKIQLYISKTLVLMPPHPGLPLLLYLMVIDTSTGVMLTQNVEVSYKEKAIYYVSRKFTDYESKYSALEKTCAALVGVTKKLRHYLLHYSVKLISRMDPLKYLFEKPALSSRMARYLFLLSEYDISYVTLKAVKGIAVADYLAENPLAGEEWEEVEFPDESISTIFGEAKWRLYFDGASNKKGCGVGMLLVSPNEEHSPLAIKLS